MLEPDEECSSRYSLNLKTTSTKIRTYLPIDSFEELIRSEIPPFERVKSSLQMWNPNIPFTFLFDVKYA